MALLENIISQGQEMLSGRIQKEAGLSDADSKKAVQVAGESFADGIKNQVSAGNISGLAGLLKGGGQTGGNPIMKSIASGVVGSLTGKLGLPAGVAEKVSAIAMPFILEKVSSHFSGGNDVNAQSLLALVGGGEGIGDSIKEGLGNKLGGLGKLF